MARSNISEFLSYCKQEFNDSELITRNQIFQVKNKYNATVALNILMERTNIIFLYLLRFGNVV